eukprot:gene1002-241_t
MNAMIVVRKKIENRETIYERSSVTIKRGAFRGLRGSVLRRHEQLPERWLVTIDKDQVFDYQAHELLKAQGFQIGVVYAADLKLTSSMEQSTYDSKRVVLSKLLEHSTYAIGSTMLMWLLEGHQVPPGRQLGVAAELREQCNTPFVVRAILDDPRCDIFTGETFLH